MTALFGILMLWQTGKAMLPFSCHTCSHGFWNAHPRRATSPSHASGHHDRQNPHSVYSGSCEDGRSGEMKSADRFKARYRVGAGPYADRIIATTPSRCKLDVGEKD